MRLQQTLLLASLVLPACGDATEGSGTTAGLTTDPALTTSTTDGTESTEDPSGSTSGETTGEPTTGEPTTGEPTTGEPTTEDPTDEPTTEDPTTEDPTEDPTTGEPTTEDPTDDPTDSDTDNPVCGNGVVDPGESCDDGNDDETDACTSLCAPPSCDDGIQSGDETDVDCGGPDCESCDNLACEQAEECPGQLCVDNLCTHAPNCEQLLFLNPGLQDQDGMYEIDPDGMGGDPPFAVHCDMTFDGGGWTRLLLDDFEDNGDGWSKTQTTTCGMFGKILGGYGQFGNETVTKMVDTFGIEHFTVLLRADYYAVDSWDGEQAYARIDNMTVWEVGCDHQSDGCNHMSNGNICGGSYPEGNVSLEAVEGHMGEDLLIAFGSTLNQSTTDESWGVDNVEVYVR